MISRIFLIFIMSLTIISCQSLKRSQSLQWRSENSCFAKIVLKDNDITSQIRLAVLKIESDFNGDSSLKRFGPISYSRTFSNDDRSCLLLKFDSMAFRDAILVVRISKDGNFIEKYLISSFGIM